MKKILLLICCLLPILVQAQVYNRFLGNPYMERGNNGFRNYVNTGFSYNLNSTAITNSFYNKYLYSNFIDEEAKETVLPHLGRSNRFGAYGEQFITYYFRPKAESPLSYFIDVKNRRHQGAHFTKDAYELVFFGNKHFAGKEAVLDNTNIYRMNYQTLSGGLAYEGKNYTLQGSLGLTRGTRFSDINFGRTRFYTSPGADSLNIQVAAEASYTNLRGPEATAGWGAAASFAFYYFPSEKSKIAFGIQDLGFVHYSSAGSRTFRTNQTLIYRGYEAFNVSNETNAQNLELLPDRIYREVDSSEKSGSFTAIQPAQMHLVYQQQLAKNTQALLAAEYFFVSNHLPSVHFNVVQQFAPWLSVQGGFKVLGYGKYGVITAVTANVAGFGLSAGTEHLEALVAPKNTFGQGAFVRLSWRN